MNKRELIAVLEANGMRPGRGLGQNFLMDRNLLEWIARRGAPRPGEAILEVGPGFGALTRLLLASGAEVTAVEFDRRVAGYLRREIDAPNFRLVEADACRVDYAALFDGRPFRAVANLPYAISTVLIAKLTALETPPEDMLFMLQKEMGERLAAPPGCRAYGALTVQVQQKYDVTIEKVVPPEVFFPPPEVFSALVSFRRHHRLELLPADRKRFVGVAKLLFSQRRKKLGKVLAGSVGRERAQCALAASGIPPDLRPDKLTVEKFAFLAAELGKNSPPAT